MDRNSLQRHQWIQTLSTESNSARRRTEACTRIDRASSGAELSGYETPSSV